MPERHREYEHDYGRDWRGGEGAREEYGSREGWRTRPDQGGERWQGGRDRSDWRDRNDWRERDRGEWRGEWQGGRSSEPEWRGTREWRAGSRDWHGEGEPFGYQRGASTGRGAWEHERYPDENYGGRAYGRGAIHPEWSDERRSGWERDWRSAGRDRGTERYGWGDRSQYGYQEDEGLGYADRDYGRGRGRGLYGTESGRDDGEYPGQEAGWRYGSPRWGSQIGGRQYEYGSFAGRGPKDYRRSDERILEDISDRLTDDPTIDASDITLQVKNGEVTLSGTVESREMKRRAEDIAEQVSGVRDVSNQLRVNKGFFRQLFGGGEDRGPQQQQGEPQRQTPGVAPGAPGTQQRPKVSG